MLEREKKDDNGSIIDYLHHYQINNEMQQFLHIVAL